jgi:alanine racemase
MTRTFLGIFFANIQISFYSGYGRSKKGFFMKSAAWVQIDLGAIRSNLQKIRELAPQSKILAMIKADAYGHGLLPVAKAIPEADGFGITTFDDALSLRQAGCKQTIVLMHGFFEKEDLQTASFYDLHLVIHNHEQIQMLTQASLEKPVNVWLKIDTGMHRLGFAIEEVENAYVILQSCKNVQKPICLLSHFANSDQNNHFLNLEQKNQFAKITNTLSGVKSMENSAAILTANKNTFDWIRPGFMLYGASPFPDRIGRDLGLSPAMSVMARILSIKNFQKGSFIGYGSTYQATRDGKMAVISIGYGNGYPKDAINGTPVLVGDKLCFTVGRVSMDMLTIDITDHPSIQLQDIVTLWGKNLPVEKVAEYLQCSPYELFCRVSKMTHFYRDSSETTLEKLIDLSKTKVSS